MRTKQEILKELQTIPGVGKSIAEDLYILRIRSVKNLRNKNPQKLYEQLQLYFGKPVDRCMLYVFRCAVYFSKTKNPTAEKLKWWHWKDK